MLMREIGSRRLTTRQRKKKVMVWERMEIKVRRLKQLWANKMMMFSWMRMTRQKKRKS